MIEKQTQEMKQSTSDLLQKAYKALPEQIDKKPAYAIHDAFGNMCAIELTKYIVVARGAASSQPGHGAVVSISRSAVEGAARLGFEVLLYLESTQKFYPVTVDYIKEHYIRVTYAGHQSFYVVPLKGFVEYRQQKFENMQEALF